MVLDEISSLWRYISEGRQSFYVDVLCNGTLYLLDGKGAQREFNSTKSVGKGQRCTFERNSKFKTSCFISMYNYELYFSLTNTTDDRTVYIKISCDHETNILYDLYILNSSKKTTWKLIKSQKPVILISIILEIY